MKPRLHRPPRGTQLLGATIACWLTCGAVPFVLRLPFGLDASAPFAGRRARGVSRLPAHAVADGADPGQGAGSGRSKLAELFRADPSAIWRWGQHCVDNGVGSAVLEEAPAGFIDEFLKSYSAGAIPDVELASPDMVDGLNRIRQAEPGCKWLWAQYCAEEGPRVFNPVNVPASFLQRFLERHSEGSLPSVALADEDTARTLTSLQRSSSSGQWRRMTTEKTFGIKDPAAFPAEVARSILADYVPDGQATPPKKKRRDSNDSNADPKQLLRIWVQNRMSKDLTTLDIEYSLDSDEPPYTATISVSDVVRAKVGVGSTQAFTGEASPSRAEAKRSAASEALKILQAPRLDE